MPRNSSPVKAAANFLFALVCFCLFAGTAAAQPTISPTNHIELFNGTNFDGWTFCMRSDADPSKTWSVTNGLIHCNGSAIGYMRTTQSYSNYAVTVVWRFVKVEPKKDNTGVLVHIQSPDKVWPMCVQNQGKSGRQGDLFVMSGAECKEHKGMDANTPIALRGLSRENAVGEWNTNTTTCIHSRVNAIINGKFVNQINECTITSGAVGIQSEGADFEIRKISVDSLLSPIGNATDTTFGPLIAPN